MERASAGPEDEDGAGEGREEPLAHPGYELIWEEYPSGETRWATSLKSIFGYDLSEPQPSMLVWWMERVHPDDREPSKESYRRAIESGATTFSVEYRFRRKDGRYVWVCTRGTIERDAQGRVVRMIGGTLDIDRFRETETRLRLLVEQLPAMAWATDRDLRILWSMGAGLSVDPRELIGKTIAEAIREYGGRPAAVEAHLRALGGEKCNYEGGSGEMVLEAHVQPFRDAEGRIVGTIGVGLDISERKRAEEALRKSRQQLLEAQRAGQVRVWEDDVATGRLTTDFQRLLTGAPPAGGSLPEEDVMQLIHPDDRAQVLEARRRAVEEGKPFVAEYRIRHASGKERVVLSRGEVIRDEAGRPLRIVGTAVDITERKQAEEVLRRTQRLLLDAEVLGHTGSWEMDLLTGEVTSTEENRRLFFGDDSGRGKRQEDYAEAFHPDDRQALNEEMKRISQGGESRDLEYRIIRPDGSVRVILSRIQVLRDAAGRPARTFGTNADITERKQVEKELARRAWRHAAAAQIGLKALRSSELQPLFDETAALVAFALAVDFAAVMEARPEGRLLLRAGAGAWKEGAVGAASICEGFPEYAMQALAPVACDDFAAETRFAPGALLLEHGIRSGVSVSIQGRERPFGVLAALAQKPRTWSQDDLNFLQTTAHMLASTIERERVAAELRVKREQLQSLSRLLIQAQEAERHAVARELHDDFGQVLTAIKLNLERTGSASPLTTENIVLVEQALQRMRDLAYGLRPPLLDEVGLGPALRWYVGREATRAGLEAELSVADLRLLMPMETTCFRVVQEALTNVARHAQARRVEVTLSRVGDEVQLAIRDDGKGFDLGAARARAATGGSQGLLGMQERVSLAGGELEIDSASGSGTTVLVRFRFAEGR